VTLQLGIGLALFCAIATNLGSLYKYRGACAAPAVDLRRPLATAGALFRSKWFLVGWLVGTGAWFFHVAALAMAPISIVQAVIAGGLVFLTVMAERVFGYEVGTRQWAGVGLTGLGLVLLAVTLPATEGAHSAYSLAGMVAFEGGLLAVGTLLVLSPKVGGMVRHHEHHGIMLGIAAGLLFGVAHIALKALTGQFGDGGVLAMVSPWLLTAIVAGALAFFASARAFQRGQAVPVITTSTAACNVASISGGLVVFGDPMPGDALGIVIQGIAFVMVIVAAALTPAPLRVAESRAT
jgi:hypothetical protein